MTPPSAATDEARLATIGVANFLKFRASILELAIYSQENNLECF